MTRRLLVLALAGMTVGLGIVVSAGQQATFRTGTDLVSVYVTVTDESGRLVADLTREDFTVADNGKRQVLTQFSNGLFPFSAVVMLDRSGSMKELFALVRDGAAEFVRAMRPDDRVRIGSFANHVEILPEDFTSSQDALIRILDGGLQPIGPSPVWTAIDKSITALLPEPGRRVVLAFTDGHNQPGGWGMAITHLDDVVRRVRVNEIMVYSIGFATPYNQGGGQSFPGGPGSIPRGPIGQGGGGLLGTRSMQPPDPGLKDLAEESGGGYFEVDESNDLRGTFARVAEELHRQYWLGFAPATLDGKEHKLEVKVTRRGMKIRARKSYLPTSVNEPIHPLTHSQ